jgi:aquaporin Z
MPMTKRLAAEFIGTLWLVLGGCGAAVLAAKFPGLGIGFVGVSLAFGLTVLTMMYAVSHISGGHLNPAISVGLCAGGRFPVRDLIPYVVAQVLGGAAGAGVLYIIASGQPGFDAHSGFAANGFGEHSPGGYSLGAGFLTELVMTFAFVFVIMGATHGAAPKGFAPIAIGFCLTLINLISIPVTNCSVNPARSTGPALYAGGWALKQLWLFWVAPLLGGALGGVVYRWVGGESPAPTPVTGQPERAAAAR